MSPSCCSSRAARRPEAPGRIQFISTVQHYFIRTFRSGELVAQRDFRLFWISAVTFTFGHEISGLVMPLTAALLLHASPSQMGQMVALGLLPFVLFSLPAGVMLDRVRKYPVLMTAELVALLATAMVPLAYWFGWLSMDWMYGVFFVLGCVNVVGGSANQVFLTHLVGRERLIDAHSRFAATDSVAKLVAPGLAGMLVQWLTAPFALLSSVGVFFAAWLNMRRVRTRDPQPAPKETHPLHDMGDGLRMIWRHPLLWPLAWSFACWQLLFNGYAALSVLFATRELGLSAGMLGAMQMFGGVGVLVSSALIKPCTRRFGLGRTILLGMGGTALGWLAMPLLPASLFDSATLAAFAYGALVFFFDCSVMLMIMPYLAMRQRVTPDAYLGRMTATMRFLTVAVAPAGAFGMGWLAEHVGVRTALGTVGISAVLLVAALALFSPLRSARVEGADHA